MYELQVHSRITPIVRIRIVPTQRYQARELLINGVAIEDLHAFPDRDPVHARKSWPGKKEKPAVDWFQYCHSRFDDKSGNSANRNSIRDKTQIDRDQVIALEASDPCSTMERAGARKTCDEFVPRGFVEYFLKSDGQRGNLNRYLDVSAKHRYRGSVPAVGSPAGNLGGHFTQRVPSGHHSSLFHRAIDKNDPQGVRIDAI